MFYRFAPTSQEPPQELGFPDEFARYVTWIMSNQHVDEDKDKGEGVMVFRNALGLEIICSKNK